MPVDLESVVSWMHRDFGRPGRVKGFHRKVLRSLQTSSLASAHGMQNRLVKARNRVREGRLSVQLQGGNVFNRRLPRVPQCARKSLCMDLGGIMAVSGMMIDTHIHLWDLDRLTYSWLQEIDPGEQELFDPRLSL
jgi:hypothetical protein